MARKTKIFTIYAWEDKNAMLQLLRHLKPFEEDFDLTFWNDDPINTGQQWMPEDESRLNTADIFLLLVSADFMNSEFIKQLEFKNIIDRYKEKKSVVIPIILEYCRWEIDFKSDDYNFNLNELQILPGGGKPLENWMTPDLAFEDIASNVKKVISSFSEGSNDKAFKIEEAKDAGKDQMAMDFSEEDESKKTAEEKHNTKEELESKRVAEEQQRLEAAEKAEEELNLRKEVEAKKRAEEDERLLKQDEARMRAEQEQGESAKEVIEAERRAEEKRLLEEAEAKKRAEEEQRINEEVEAEARRIEEKNRLKEEKYQEEEYQEEYSSESNEYDQETGSVENKNTRKRILSGSLVALLAILGIWAFSKFNQGGDTPESYLPDTGEVEVKGPPGADEAEIDSSKTEEDFSKLLVGDTHAGGVIFTIDYINKTGKIAHIDDAGPMPWKEAMKVDEKLGEGWRLPTMDELRLIHKSIGQGSDNKGEFADELYWSATAYDSNQARLVRFTDGNTSYHYNSRGTHRKFLVRAIRDFNR